MFVLFTLAVALLLLGSALWVDRKRRGTSFLGGSAGHPDDPESKLFNRYDRT
ncbi:hypothetical protein ACT8ZV_18690 [Nocardioides sp. MAHUQ-72]|uniref:hypothetical protein n=1 Tax=unclassified Nocardioides TaxID=2615069 RepID=UPI00360F71CD